MRTIANVAVAAGLVLGAGTVAAQGIARHEEHGLPAACNVGCVKYAPPKMGPIAAQYPPGLTHEQRERLTAIRLGKIPAPTVAAPEPGAIVLVATGLIGVAAIARRRRA